MGINLISAATTDDVRLTPKIDVIAQKKSRMGLNLGHIICVREWSTSGESIFQKYHKLLKFKEARIDSSNTEPELRAHEEDNTERLCESVYNCFG